MPVSGEIVLPHHSDSTALRKPAARRLVIGVLDDSSVKITAESDRLNFRPRMSLTETGKAA